jgi:uncharacterized protein (DUF736 family)
MAAGKRPKYRLVLGKRTCGTLWEAESKGGLHYFSGDIDLTALRAAVKEGTVKQKPIRVNKDGKMEDHDTIRCALFDATVTPKGGASKSPDDF